MEAFLRFLKAAGTAMLVATAITTVLPGNWFEYLVMGITFGASGVLIGGLVFVASKRLTEKPWLVRPLSAIISFVIAVVALNIVVGASFHSTPSKDHIGHITLSVIILNLGTPIVGIVAAVFGAGAGQLPQHPKPNT